MMVESLAFLLMDNLIMLVESILLFLFADMFLHRRWRGAMPLLPAIAISWCCQFLVARLAVGQGKIIVSLTLDFLWLLIYYQQNRSIGCLLKKLFLLASFYVFMAVTQAIPIAALYHFFRAGTADLHADPVLALGAYTISLLLNMLCLHICERFRQVEVVPLSTRSWLSLLATPTVSAAFVWLFFPFGRKTVDDYALQLIAGLSISLLAANLFVFCLYRNIAKTTALQCRHEDLQQYCKHLNDLLHSEGKRRDVIHDYLHNLGVIAALIESGCANDAATFIYRLEERIRKIHAVKYTGNQEVDAVLSGKLPLMQAKRISFRVGGNPPSDLAF